MGNFVIGGARGGSIGETRVTVFRNVMSNGGKNLSVEERGKEYSASRNEPIEMTLLEFLKFRVCHAYSLHQVHIRGIDFDNSVVISVKAELLLFGYRQVKVDNFIVDGVKGRVLKHSSFSL